MALAMAPYTRHQVPEDPAGVFQYYEALGTRSGLALMPYNTQGWSAELFGAVGRSAADRRDQGPLL